MPAQFQFRFYAKAILYFESPCSSISSYYIKVTSLPFVIDFQIRFREDQK